MGNSEAARHPRSGRRGNGRLDVPSDRRGRSIRFGNSGVITSRFQATLSRYRSASEAQLAAGSKGLSVTATVSTLELARTIRRCEAQCGLRATFTLPEFIAEVIGAIHLVPCCCGLFGVALRIVEDLKFLEQLASLSRISTQRMSGLPFKSRRSPLIFGCMIGVPCTRTEYIALSVLRSDTSSRSSAVKHDSASTEIMNPFGQFHVLRETASALMYATTRRNCGSPPLSKSRLRRFSRSWNHLVTPSGSKVSNRRRQAPGTSLSCSHRRARGRPARRPSSRRCKTHERSSRALPASS